MSEETQKKEIKAIIGLGNPGSKYSWNRHNIGFRIINSLAKSFFVSWKSSENMEVAQVRLNQDGGESTDVFTAGKMIYLIKPQTFMNSSGKVVPFLQKRGISAENVLVIHDELEKKFGQLSIRFGGSARGHNGLRSLISIIGPKFWRFRFGIGRPDDRQEVSNYVLSNFTAEEEEQMPSFVESAVNQIKEFCE
jgi:peptidyl-tRNA hydrolase, PTH1 family